MLVQRAKSLPRQEEQSSASPSSEDSSVVFTPYELRDHDPFGKFELHDLGLLHHWILHTSSSISQCWSDGSHCRVNLFGLGLDHPFVMYGMLSIAGLHMASLKPFVEKGLLETAVLHHCRGLKQFHHLQGMEASNDALRAFSILNLIYTLATFGPLAGLTGKIAESNRFINPDWTRQLRATTPAVGIWQYPTTLEEIDARTESTAEDDHLVHIRETYRDNAAADVEAYDSTLMLLRRCYHWTSGPRSDHADDKTPCDFNKWNGALNFLCGLSDEYIERLHQRQPPALIIFSFFGAMIALQDESWFIKGWAKSIVSAVNNLLGSYWAPHTKWCREVVALQSAEVEE
ncbi:hypothetical protein FDECE_2659 [Fusarium decemcellulare]|nr:hypothetical protein FDECE_2659 [Fusarium decemcellulare]